MYKIYDNSSADSYSSNKKGNLMVYSAFDKIQKTIPFNNFAIKYVMTGIEKYYINGEDYFVNGGEYLLCNPHCEGGVLIDSKNPVDGLCIELSMDILSEAVASYRRADNPMPDSDLDNFFKSGYFLESKYNAAYTALGKKLKSLHKIIGCNPHEDHILNKEFYFGLAEDIVTDCAPMHKQFQGLPSIKDSTKKDIMRRLTKGKDFIDVHFTSDIYVEQIAAEALMSQYHFYRLFKKVYGKSPYQYIKEKRLTLAHQYILNGDDSITEIALKVGYADLFSFSKGYKQFFGKSPSSRE